MTITNQIICAEAPIALVITDWGVIAPLTPCCRASGKGCDGYIGCRACYREVSYGFGDCWKLDEERGWGTYFDLVAAEICADQLDTDGRTDPAAANAKATELVAHAREKATAVFEAG